MALRCLHCGDVIDRVIVRNRQLRRYPQPKRVRTPVYEGNCWKTAKPAFV